MQIIASLKPRYAFAIRILSRDQRHQEHKYDHTSTTTVAGWFFNYNQKDATIFYYLFLKGSTCFGRFLRPSSGAHNCTLSFMYCQPVLLQAGIVDEMELHGVIYCYRWSWFEAISKVCSAERQAKVHDKNKVKFGTYSKRISFVCCTLVRCVLYTGTLCAVHWYVAKMWASRLLVLSLLPCLSHEWCGVLFSLGYKDAAALSPWELYVLYPFRLTAISQLLCLRTVETAKLAQAGFGDFLAEAHVSRLKGKVWWQ